MIYSPNEVQLIVYDTHYSMGWHAAWLNFLTETADVEEFFQWQKLEQYRAIILKDEFHARIIDTDFRTVLAFENPEYQTLFLVRYS